MSEEKILQTLTGTIIFQKTNEGSKSESMQPFLYVNQNQVVHVFMNNSNPFENNSLQAYDGCNVTVEGYMNNETLVINSINSNAE